jgi:hypothetical protein
VNPVEFAWGKGRKGRVGSERRIGTREGRVEYEGKKSEVGVRGEKGE